MVRYLIRWGPVLLALGILTYVGYLLNASKLWDQAISARDESQTVSSPRDPVEAAWQAVHQNPNDSLLWVRLGEAQAKMDQLESAEHSFRTAIRLGNKDGLAYARLGFILYAREEDHQALTLLSEARRRGAQVPMLDYTLESLQERVHPAKPPPSEPIARAPIDAGVGRVSEATPVSLDAGWSGSIEAPSSEPLPIEREPAERESVVEAPPDPEPEPEPDGICEIAIRRAPQRRTFLVDMAIDGVEATLALDTGASITVLTRAFVEETGVRWIRQPSIWAITANGRVEMQTGLFSRITIADRVVDNLRVAICDDCVQSFSDGLLGLDVQASMGMKIDLVRERIEFADCE